MSYLQDLLFVLIDKIRAKNAKPAKPVLAKDYQKSRERFAQLPNLDYII